MGSIIGILLCIAILAGALTKVEDTDSMLNGGNN
jgi:hypothetical protein